MLRMECLPLPQLYFWREMPRDVMVCRPRRRTLRFLFCSLLVSLARFHFCCVVSSGLRNKHEQHSLFMEWPCDLPSLASTTEPLSVTEVSADLSFVFRFWCADDWRSRLEGRFSFERGFYCFVLASLVLWGGGFVRWLWSVLEKDCLYSS